MTAPSNLHMAWARLFVRSLAASGVTDAILSPGSRSAPLAIALAEEPALRLHVVLDERTAAFFALGQARVTGRPSVLVCTSGTAGAHYLPAMIEASLSFVPMLAVTADRPWDLYDAAAPQTIDQVKLFGGVVRHFAELGLPDAAPSALRAVARIAAQAVATSVGPTPGPVHVNARFRKPLEPVAGTKGEAWEPLVASLLGAAPTRVFRPRPALDEAALGEVTARIAKAQRGLIVCGPAPLAQGPGRDAILELARAAAMPLVAEATSQVRFGGDREGVVEGGPVDTLLRSRGVEAPDFVLQIGAPPTSAAFADLCARDTVERVVAAPHGWNDPQGTATALIHADAGAFAAALVARSGRLAGSRRDEAWHRSAAELSGKAAMLLRRDLAGGEFFEGRIAERLVASAPNDALLVVGNSTPVRDLDTFCAPGGSAVRVLHQRGASGIDGLVAGACGALAADDGPCALLLGDLSFAHDLTSLALAARVARPMPIVVVQNGGGRIFEQLPVASAISKEVFERCFATPASIDTAAAAAAYGVTATRVASVEGLDAALAEAWRRPRATVIEAVVAPNGRARRIRGFWEALDRSAEYERARA